MRKLRRSVAYPAWCADAWVMVQLYRKLGIEPDDIYFGIAHTTQHGPNSVRVCAKEGELEFNVSIAPAGMPEKKACEAWQRFATSMNSASDAEHQAVWDGSLLQRALPRVELILRMIDKGFTLKGCADLPPDLQDQLRRFRARGAGNTV